MRRKWLINVLEDATWRKKRQFFIAEETMLEERHVLPREEVTSSEK